MTEEDARLIAAAPELLAACKALMRAEFMAAEDTPAEYEAAIIAIHAAVAKAEPWEDTLNSIVGRKE
jgi:hypothetical protein